MLTPDQQAALELDYHISVTAGAGSGKTTILVQKYLDYLDRRSDMGLHQILALTFTNKAAQEMKARIRSRVAEFLEDPNQSPKKRARWKKIFEEIGSAYLSTIHGFCARVLKEYPIRADTDPDFQIVEGADRKLLLEESVFETLRTWEDEGFEPYRKLLYHYPKREIVQTLLATVGGDTDQFPRLNPLKDRELTAGAMELFYANRRVNRRLEELAPLLPPPDTSDVFARLHQLVDGKEGWEELGLDGEPLMEIIGDLFFTKSGNKRSGFKTLLKGMDPEEVEEADPILKDIASQVGRYGEIFNIEQARRMEALSLEFLGYFHQLIDVAGESFVHRKNRDHLLDFEDLQHRTLAFLEENPGIRTFDVIMVDEFQDTNKLQWEIIRRLVRPDGQSNIFLVGDEKQSIYGFRGAEVEVFSQVRKKLIGFNRERKQKDPEKVIKLRDNFRSLDHILDMVNHTFDKLLGPTHRLVESEPEPIALVTGRRVPPAGDNDPQGGVEFIIGGLDDDAAARVDEQREHQADLIARRITEGVEEGHPRQLFVIDKEFDGKAKVSKKILTSHEYRYLRGLKDHEKVPYVRPAKYQDMVILIRSRTILPQIEEALRRYGIPYFVPSGVGYFQRQEIKDATAVLKTLVFPHDDYAFFGALRSEFFGFPDQLLYALSSLPGSTLFRKFRSALRFWQESLVEHKEELSALPLEDRIDPIQTYAQPHKDDYSQILAYLYEPIEEGYPLTGWDLVLQTAHHLDQWKLFAGRLPTSELIRLILDQSGFLGAMAATPSGKQRIANLEKFLELARGFATHQRKGLRAFVRKLEWQIDSETDEGEAQLDVADDAVRIFTIHMSKGLQFPIVFLGQVSKTFRTISDPFIWDDDLGTAIRVPDPENLHAKGDSTRWAVIDSRSKNKNLAEEKRLLYVGMTRAEDHLIFCGYRVVKSMKIDKSWLAWMGEHLGMDGANLDRGKFTSENNGAFLHFLRPGMDTPEREGMVIPLLSEGDLAAQDVDRRLISEVYREITTPEKLAPPPEIVPPKLPEGAFYQTDPTSLSDFHKCPRKYFLQRMAGWKRFRARKLESEDEATWDEWPEDEMDEPLPPFSEKAKDKGTIYHRALELFIKGVSTQEILQQVDAEFPLHDLSHKKLQGTIQRFEKSPLGVKILGRGDRHPEEPFLFRLGNTLIKGIVDLLWAGKKEVWVVDFKFTKVNEYNNPDVLRERYRIPMSIYSLVAWKRFGVSPGQVHTCLVSTETPDEPMEYPKWTKKAFGEVEKELEDLCQRFNRARSLGHMEAFPAFPEKCHNCLHQRLCQGDG